MASLLTLNKKLEKRLDYLTEGFNRAKSVRTTERRIDQVHRTEGLLSSLWQSWCGFVRGLIIESVIGADTAMGAGTTSPYSHLTIDQVRTAAAKISKGNPIPAVPRPILGHYQEPTWGDIRKATLIVNGLSLSNSNSIITGMGILTFGKDVQIVRNASAHLSSDGISDIRNLQLRYLDTSFRHPTDAAFWVEPTTRVDAWAIWIDEYRSSAQFMVR